MEDQDKKQTPMWQKLGHGKPLTRREMLATGMIGFAGGMMAPNLFRMLMPEEALAQSLPLTPFMHLHLAGGAALASNVPPKDKGGQYLSNYNLMGLGKSVPPMVKPPFTGPDFYKDSGFLRGLTGAVDAYDTAVYAGVRMFAICSLSRDDSAENRFDISGSLGKLGLRGSILPSLGTDNTITGNGTQPALDIPPPMLPVSSFNSILNALAYTGQIANFTAKQKGAVAKLINRLSATQTARLLRSPSGQTLKDLLDSANLSNVTNMSGNPQVDPRGNADIQKIFAQTANTNDNNTRFAGIAWSVLNNYSSMAKMTLGGYDYHDNTRVNGDNKDAEAGALVGRLLSTAKALNKPLYLLVTTDGAVTGPATDNAADAVWTSDRGRASMTYVFTYSPTGAPSLKTTQLGYYTIGQVTDDSYVGSATPELTAATVYSNYLYFTDAKTAEKNFHDTARGALPDLEVPKVNVFNV